MSNKRGKSAASSAGVFISFSDVADSSSYASQSPGGSSFVEPAATVVEHTFNNLPESAICYSGPYPQIALLCRRIMKKDGVTKLKAIKELRSVLKV